MDLTYEMLIHVQVLLMVLDRAAVPVRPAARGRLERIEAYLIDRYNRE